MSITVKQLALAASAALVFLAGAAHADAPAKMASGVLVAPSGMTLYVFDKDAGGKSMCNGPCATNWPPLMAAADDKPMGDYSIVTRDDGSRQWAYKGKPVYTFKSDAKAGDRTGDNFKDVWHVIKE